MVALLKKKMNNVISTNDDKFDLEIIEMEIDDAVSECECELPEDFNDEEMRNICENIEAYRDSEICNTVKHYNKNHCIQSILNNIDYTCLCEDGKDCFCNDPKPKYLLYEFYQYYILFVYHN